MKNTTHRSDATLDGARVMIVEDEVILALDLAMSLDEEGAEVVGPFHRLSTAMAQDLSGIEAVVLDLDLNGREAFPLADRLYARGIPVLFHTARATFDPGTYPGSALCRKPCLSDALMRRLSALIAASRRANLDTLLAIAAREGELRRSF